MFAHCKIKYGEAVVIAKYDTDVDLIDDADFKTGNIEDSNGGKNGIYTGTRVNGSNDGQIVKNYKNNTVHSIQKMTQFLIDDGYNHGGINFHVSDKNKINGLGRAIEHIYALINGVIDGSAMTGKTFEGSNGTYTFENDLDFITWFQTGAGITQLHIQAGALLIAQVTLAENTEEAMTPIHAANEARHP
jgi:hypothetical protein